MTDFALGGLADGGSKRNFFLAGLAIAVTVINALLKQAGREEYSYLVLLVGLVVALLRVLPLVLSLFTEVQSVFSLY